MTTTAFPALSFGALNMNKKLAAMPEETGHHHQAQLAQHSVDTVRFGSQPDGTPDFWSTPISRRGLGGLAAALGAAVALPATAATPAAAAPPKDKPYGPTNRKLFTERWYGVTNSLPATKVKSQRDIERELECIFNNRRGVTVRQGMAVYKDRDIDAKIQLNYLDPVLQNPVSPAERARQRVYLKAAIASVYGSFGHSAIDALKNNFERIMFVDFRDPNFKIMENGQLIHPNETTVALSTFGAMTAPDGTVTEESRPTAVFNSVYEYEDIRRLGKIFAHEMLHQDKQKTKIEEKMATVLETVLDSQLVAENANIVNSKTKLSRDSQTMDMALLNTRTGGRVNLTQADWPTVFPGGREALANFNVALNALTASLPDGNSPGNGHLTAMMNAVTGNNAHGIEGFDDNSWNILNAYVQDGLKDNGWRRVANNMELRKVNVFA